MLQRISGALLLVAAMTWMACLNWPMLTRPLAFGASRLCLVGLLLVSWGGDDAWC